MTPSPIRMLVVLVIVSSLTPTLALPTSFPYEREDTCSLTNKTINTTDVINLQESIGEGTLEADPLYCFSHIECGDECRVENRKLHCTSPNYTIGCYINRNDNDARRSCCHGSVKLIGKNHQCALNTHDKTFKFPLACLSSCNCFLQTVRIIPPPTTHNPVTEPILSTGISDKGIIALSVGIPVVLLLVVLLVIIIICCKKRENVGHFCKNRCPKDVASCWKRVLCWSEETPVADHNPPNPDETTCFIVTTDAVESVNGQVGNNGTVTNTAGQTPDVNVPIGGALTDSPIEPPAEPTTSDIEIQCETPVPVSPPDADPSNIAAASYDERIIDMEDERRVEKDLLQLEHVLETEPSASSSSQPTSSDVDEDQDENAPLVAD